MWIKICGVSDQATAEAAARAGADAIGMVFSPSVRQLSIDRAELLLQGCPAGLQTVAVLRNPERSLVEEILDRLAPDYLQSDLEDWQDSMAGLKALPGCHFLPVVRNKDPGNLPPICLFEGSQSGSGQLADWRLAESIARRTPLVLAGGLTPANVAEAIRTVRPFGVDVSSGVEESRGKKSASLIEEFVGAARRAAAAINLEQEQ